MPTNPTQASQQVPSGMTTIEQRARELLAIEYERGGQYPSYADMARTASGAFTQCAIRAVKAALMETVLAQSATAATEDARRNEPKVGEKWYVKLPGHHELVLRTVDKITDKIVVLSFTKEKWSTGEYISYPTTYERGYVDLVESYFASLNRAALSKGIAHE